jgi:hypothetical protein
MSCHSVINSLSAHLDGFLSGEERRELLDHLNRCPRCEARLGQLARVRNAVRKLPANAPPEQLTAMLRVMASKERQRVIARQRHSGILQERFLLWVENLMRPIALPFAGGLISALLLFGMLIPTFAFRPVAPGNDVPVALITEPTIKFSMPFGIEGDVDVAVLVDDQGRMVDYSITSGPNTPELRRAIENNLLFTEFTPATMFGSPTWGRIHISFQRRTIDIKS